MYLNCDLGESYGQWQMGLDTDVLPHVDMANIACGFHAGDPCVIANTLKLTQLNQNIIGAHPSYPDRQGFGRRSMQCSSTELTNLLHYQIAALDGMASIYNQSVSYVKPHGALYNDMMRDQAILTSVMQSVASYKKPLKLMILATGKAEQHAKQAEQLGLELFFEAFADRRYDDHGYLQPRSQAGSVLDKQQILQQVEQLKQRGTVTTNTGQTITLKADTLCVHGDNPESIALVKQIKQICQSSL
ncbi:LamB/YcsF family protein [Saccharobesus litoralis]|uniref:LamB/YcsF family protein n=1 Tax=Saccharobesus litoralis TaxID=2172099 RepID=A0A2S0VPT8_9ALTE|nr:5-oxoprolinase subunit PxpA [Saccharobesus litoralis]AWB66226.1 LamB/YcsF family protein [Saccharobesus litoralis]